ncbi:hypothetical protein FRC00_004192 [Tulasnella sp. 408]|nr:hypothetical protein FRC00_004192 [Tulasnella sp. 408]
MAAPQHNHPYTSYISEALTRFASSLIANYGFDDAEEDEVLAQVLQPAPHENQEPQGHAASTPEPDVTADSQDTLPASVDSAIAPGDLAALDDADETLTESLEEASTQLPTATRYSTPAWEAGDVPETTSLHPVPFEYQPQAGPSTATSSTGPDRSPRRSSREAGRRASQLLSTLLTPLSRRRRRVSAASSGRGPSTSPTSRQRSPPPSVQSTQPTPSTTATNATSTQDEMYAEVGPSARALGKRRRVEDDIKKEEEDSEFENGSPSKKARRVRNLRNRSTPARFDGPKEEPKEEPSSPNPFLPTPLRKRALEDDEDDENKPGPSKRGRFVTDREPLTPPRTPSPAPTLTSLLTAHPSDTWSVQVQPSLSMVHTPQDTSGLPTPIASPQPSFVAVLGPMPTQAEGPPALPPVPFPVEPAPLVRTYANIFEWETPSRAAPTPTSLATAQPSETWSVQAQPSLSMVHAPQDTTGLPTPLASPQPSFVAVLGPMPTQAEGPPALPPVPVPVEPTPLVRTYAKIFEWERPRRQ